MPITAAITGFQRSELFGPMLSPGSLNMKGVLPEPTTSGSVLSSPSSPICSMRSMPVQNAFSPAPVRTTQLALHERVESVQAVRPVERDPGDAVALLVEERLEVGVHRSEANASAVRRC